MTRARALVALLLPAAAFAQPAGTPAPDPTQPTTDDPANPSIPPTDTVPDTTLPETNPPAQQEPSYKVVDHQYRTTTTEKRDTLSGYGLAISAGGGVSGFTDATARDTTNTGGGWDVRAVIGTHSPLAAEVSYIGSVQSINALGLDNDARLLGNGVQADLRLNATTNAALQPFIFAGAAWRRYDLTNTNTNTSDIADSDDVLEVPVGAGIAYHTMGVIIEARGEFRAATSADLMPSLGNDVTQNSGEASLHRWGANATIGYEF
jgi:hypothetical protein